MRVLWEAQYKALLSRQLDTGTKFPGQVEQDILLSKYALACTEGGDVPVHYRRDIAWWCCGKC